MKSLRVIVTILTAAICISSCGEIKKGSAPAPNERAPEGTVIAQGSFSSGNVPGKTVTGNAVVYLDTSNAYVIRLEGLNAPTETGLRMIAKASQEISLPLRATVGTQNYVTGLNPTLTWEYVTIRSTTNQDYGTARLAVPNPTP